MLIRNEEVKDWRDLQDKVKGLFTEMGYNATTPHVVELGGRGRKEIDVYVEDQRASVTFRILVECKWWEESVRQEVVHAFHTVMRGCGANTGFIVSKAGFQKGAREAASYTNINLVTFAELQQAYGDEWFRWHRAEVDRRVKKMASVHDLHFDQWNLLSLNNNMIFHTDELRQRLFRLHKWCSNLMNQAYSVAPESYDVTGPIQMASDPIDPFAAPPNGKSWHEAPTVRDYFQVLIKGLDGWIDEWNILEREARASLEALPDAERSILMEKILGAILEETPVRVLRQHMEAADYDQLLTKLTEGVMSNHRDDEQV